MSKARPYMFTESSYMKIYKYTKNILFNIYIKIALDSVGGSFARPDN
jgi:hypothetical protein